MGNVSIKDQMLKAIKENDNATLKKGIDENKIYSKPFNLNDYIEKEFTLIEACCYYNAFNCINLLLEDEDIKITSKSYYLCCERDNIYILQALVEKLGEDKSCNDKSCNILDQSIIYCSYRCALYLLAFFNLKAIDFYTVRNLKKDYDIELFIDCLSKKVERSKTPSFYKSSTHKQTLDGKLPDPNESWKSFLGRLYNFKLYQPPLVKKETLTEKEKKSFYVKMQAKFLKMEYNKGISNI
jgi:hypothetical protein